MNKRQKEILQAQLDSEKNVLKQLERSYKDALDEINDKISILLSRQDADMQHVIYQVEYQKALKTQVKAILETLQTNEFETISEYLAKSYDDGFIGTMYDLQGQGIPLVFPIDQAQVVAAIQNETKLSESLYTALGHDMTDLRKKITGEISRGLVGGAMYGEIARNVSNWAKIPKNNAMRIARTEAHRIQCKAAMDAQYKAKEKGADVLKQWDSSLDGRTRDSHRQIDGEIRELDEKFSNGLMYPGDPSGRAVEVINCRCALLQRARWNLGNDYTKWSPDAPVLISDDGTAQLTIIEAKNYEDFQKKYKQASEQAQEKYSNLSFMDKKELIYNNEQEIEKLYNQKKQEELNMLMGGSLKEIEQAQQKAALIQKKIDALKADNEDIQKALGLPKTAKERFYHQQVKHSTLPCDIRQDEIGAVQSWTRTDYTMINDYLRNGNKGVRLESIENANALKKMLDRNIVSEPFTVKRGTDYNALNHLFGSDKWKEKNYNVNGKIITDKGFMATTPDSLGGFGGGVQMYIDIPKGAKGAWIADISAAPNEKEFLLQCGSKFRVDRIETFEDKWGETNYDIFMKVIVDE